MTAAEILDCLIPVSSPRAVMTAFAVADPLGITISIGRIDGGGPVPSWCEMRLAPALLRQMLMAVERGGAMKERT